MVLGAHHLNMEYTIIYKPEYSTEYLGLYMIVSLIISILMEYSTMLRPASLLSINSFYTLFPNEYLEGTIRK